MRNTWAVCRREFAAFFLTPIGYVVVGMVAVISGLGFSLTLLLYSRMSQNPTTWGYPAVPDFEETVLSPFLVFCGMLIMFLSPLITMRLLAEEKHRGTIELLLTYPLKDREIIFGKYLSSLLMLLVMIIVVAVDLAIIAYLVDIEAPVLVFGFATVFLMGAAFMSLGLFVSSITRNQITSATIVFGSFLILYVVGNLGEKMPVENPAPAAWPELLRSGIGVGYNAVRALVMELPLDAHAKDMTLGIVQPYDIAYYLLFSVFFLFLTFRALESRKWRG